jgi:hypothetical protein
MMVMNGQFREDENAIGRAFVSMTGNLMNGMYGRSSEKSTAKNDLQCCEV